MGFSPRRFFFPPGDFLDPDIKRASPALAGGFFITESPVDELNQKKTHSLHITCDNSILPFKKPNEQAIRFVQDLKAVKRMTTAYLTVVLKTNIIIFMISFKATCFTLDDIYSAFFFYVPRFFRQ